MGRKEEEILLLTTEEVPRCKLCAVTREGASEPTLQ